MLDFQLTMEEEERYDALRREEEHQKLQRKRNKSKLSFSQRQALYGRPPMAGIKYELF